MTGTEDFPVKFWGGVDKYPGKVPPYGRNKI